MNRIARNWRVVISGVAAGSAAVIGFTGASASADPLVPAPPAPAPVTVTETVTVAPSAAALAVTTPAPAASPAAATPEAATPSSSEVVAAQPSALPTAAPAAVDAPFTALTPATSGTISEYLKDKGVAVEAQKAAGFTALNVVLPVPAGWSVVPDPNVPDAFGVIADRKGGDGLYTSNAQVVVYKLVGDVDAREAISHGYVDAQKLTAWKSTSVSMGEYDGLPSSIITGTYRDADLTLNTSRRYLIADSGTDKYLVSLAVTTAANQVVAAATATDAILNGFRVTKPAAAAPEPAPAPPAAAPAPAPEPVPAAALAAPAPATAPAVALAAPIEPAAAPADPAPAPVPTPATAVVATQPAR